MPPTIGLGYGAKLHLLPSRLFNVFDIIIFRKKNIIGDIQIDAANL
jgi:hypothetical protein